MSKNALTYLSNTGNTESLAHAIKDAFSGDLYYSEINEVDLERFFEADNLFLGSPACGVEEIDADYMRPFIDDNNAKFSGKRVFLFGSFGWGDGAYAETWKDEMLDAGATDVQVYTTLENPSDEALAEITAKALDFVK